MTRTVRSAAIAALTALAAIAAIIAVDLTVPISAQSGDTTGRIVARLLDDGRVEFGWQPTGGVRVLPRQRYFPAGIAHQRWLRSSPVEVDGTEIGRINARQAEDGRIEFAFTPTDGERITPQARYFPTEAHANRWLRSTEITIGPAAPRYIAVSAGGVHTCAIRANGEIACWGDNNLGQSGPREGSFTAVSAGSRHTCAIRTSGEIECWGYNNLEQSNPPEGSYTAVSAGEYHTCAIRVSGAIECWGNNSIGQTEPPEGSFTAVSAGVHYTCAIRSDNGSIECWRGRFDTPHPEGSFTAVSVSFGYACAIRSDNGAIECWGGDRRRIEPADMTPPYPTYETGTNDPPPGSYTAVSAESYHTCAIRESGAINCWGLNGYADIDDAGELQIYETGQSDAPDGSYTAVSTGGYHTCAIRASGAIECWGDNRQGQATPPTD